MLASMRSVKHDAAWKVANKSKIVTSNKNNGVL